LVNTPDNFQQLNKDMVALVKSRGVFFAALPPEEAISLKKAGANAHLIEAIEGAIPPELDEQVRIYETFTGKYTSKDLQGIREATNAAVEFLNRWACDSLWTEQVEFMKKWIPRLERRAVLITEVV